MRYIISFVLIVGTLLVGGCAGTENKDATADATAVPQVTTEEQYVIDVMEVFPSIAEEKVLPLGNSLCQAYDDGYTTDAILMAGLVDGIAEEDTTVLLRMTVPVFCPEHEKAMEKSLQ
jgi:hypothetical protein